MQKKLLLMLAFCLFACQSQNQNNSQNQNQNQTTSQEQESIDACEGDDESACTFEEKEPETEKEQQESQKENEQSNEDQPKAVIDLKQISFQEFLNEMKAKKSGYYLFGFALCPWCRELYPILEKVIKEAGVQVQYILTRDENRELLYTESQKEEAYKILKEAMPDNEEGEPTLYVPLLVCMKEGKLISFHEGTLEAHDAKTESLSKEQKEELEKELLEFFDSTKKQLENQ